MTTLWTSGREELSGPMTSSEKPPTEVMSEIIEVVTPGASALITSSTSKYIGDVDRDVPVELVSQELVPAPVTQDLDRALEAVLVFHGWQHLELQKVSEEVYSFSGVEFHLRCESVATAEQVASGVPYHLSASIDGGQTWETVASLVRSRRLHKVVRTDPIASPLDSVKGPISLADLARLPPRTSSGFGSSPCSGSGFQSPTSGWQPPGSNIGYSSATYGSNATPTSATYGSSPTFERSPHTGMPPLPLGPDGLPTHKYDGLPSFNTAFPNYFSALSGPTNYYNQFRIPDRQS